MLEWCKSSIPDVEFYLNEPMPPTGVATASFDAVYCCSVFTHLSEQAHYDWAQEHIRILKPGGILAFTTLGDRGRLLTVVKSR